jgi:serine/threonine protein kinase
VKEHQVFVTDFGISRDWTELSHGTTTGPTFGTKKYQAPEVADNLPRNSSSDIWSLGCVFLEMWSVLSGKSLDILTNYLQNHGTRSEYYYNNISGVESWSDMLLSTSCDNRVTLPKQWIFSMMRETQQDRCIAQTLLDMIQEASSIPECFQYVGFCCTEQDSIAGSVLSSLYKPASEANSTGSIFTLRAHSSIPTRTSRTTGTSRYEHDELGSSSTTPAPGHFRQLIHRDDQHAAFRPSGRIQTLPGLHEDMERAAGTPYNGGSPKENVENEDDRQKKSDVVVNATKGMSNAVASRTTTTVKVADQSQIEVNRELLDQRTDVGLALFNQEKDSESEKLLRQAADGQERTLGKDHEDTLDSKHYLGRTLLNQKRYSESEKLLRQAADGRERTLGKDHEDTLKSKHNLGLALFNQEKYSESEKLLRQAADGLERTLGKDHEYTLDSKHILEIAF